MLLRLRHQRPDGELDTYHLKSGRRYHIGRGSTCEVRILDLKLSRQHAAIEYKQGEWRVLDLGSTNGLKVDGDHMAGSAILKTGTTIEAGHTALTVERILGDDEADEIDLPPPAPAAEIPAARPAPQPTARPVTSLEEIPVAARSASIPDAAAPVPSPIPASPPVLAKPTSPVAPPHADFRTPAPLPQEPFPGEGPAMPVPRPSDAGEHHASDWKRNQDETLAPLQRKEVQPSVAPAPAPVQPPVATPAPMLDMEATIPQMLTAPSAAPAPVPAAPAPVPTAPAAAAEERTFYITVLGRRVGPLSRAVARDLKTRELKGALSLADLADYPSA